MSGGHTAGPFAWYGGKQRLAGRIADINNEHEIDGWRSHVRDDFACGIGIDEDAVARSLESGGTLR
jgi:hypothetical protein